MSKSEAGKGDTYRPVDQTKFDHNYFLAVGICDQFLCLHKMQCYRYLLFRKMEKSEEGFNIRNLVPIENWETCEWFKTIPTKS